MSQQMNNGASAEKNVAEGSAGIVDKEIVSITYSSSYFIYVLYLFICISFLENSPKYP